VTVNVFCGAPEAALRTSIASTPIPCRLSAVSLKDSPFLTLEPFARRLAACDSV
jgi:hypothetical protein